MHLSNHDIKEEWISLHREVGEVIGKKNQSAKRLDSHSIGVAVNRCADCDQQKECLDFGNSNPNQEGGYGPDPSRCLVTNEAFCRL